MEFNSGFKGLSFSITAVCLYSKIFGSRWNSFWYSNRSWFFVNLPV